MYLNLVQLAESFEVSENVVEAWIREEGLPHTPERGLLLFDRAQVAQWAATRGLATKAGFLAAASPALGATLRLAPLLRSGGIFRGVSAAAVTGIFVQVACAMHGATPPVRELLGQRLRAPDGVTYAPVGGGFALPHPTTRITLGRESGTLALILVPGGLALTEPRVDEVAVSWLWFFIAPSPRAHLDMVGRLSRLILSGALRTSLERGAGDEEILQVLEAADAAAETAASKKQEGAA
ncbi:MAG: PTS sugar transporter subunit IIA [Verrucomicrobia bacterium]|nr:MAG: PTS sugar transporter subunit IIA [Verrucomicrobiota bacterium]